MDVLTFAKRYERFQVNYIINAGNDEVRSRDRPRIFDPQINLNHPSSLYKFILTLSFSWLEIHFIFLINLVMKHYFALFLTKVMVVLQVEEI